MGTIKGQTQINNEGVQKASLLIPHDEDLQENIMSLKGLRGRVNLTTNETKDVTVTEDSGKVAIDVNVVAGGGGGGGSADSTAANQALQIAEAEESNDTLNEIETNTQETTDALVAQTLVVSKAAEQVITNVKLEELKDLVDELATQTEIQPTSNVASVVKVPWDNFQVTAKNGAGCPTSTEYKLGSTLVATVTITYDVDGDLQSLVVS